MANVAAALALLDRDAIVDAAVLDINLGEQKVYPVVDALHARGAQCVFATGNDAADVPVAYAVMRYGKPVDIGCIVQALAGSHRAAEALRHVLRPSTLYDLRSQTLPQVSLADGIGQTLVAARLCEAVDAIDVALLYGSGRD